MKLYVSVSLRPPSQSAKLQRVDAAPRGSERHFAELIAQKQRLQQLESEYALKIQKLKEAQALRNRGVLPDLPAEPAARASPPPDPQNQLPPASPFPLPQPSLHDLTQDKLALDSEDVPEADQDQEADSASAANPADSASAANPAAAAATKGGRRHSFRQSNNNFTKPHLEQLSSTPANDSGSSAKPAKSSPSSRSTAEMLAGLDVDALKQRYQQQARLGELLLRELHKLGHDVDNGPAGKVNVIRLAALVELFIFTCVRSCALLDSHQRHVSARRNGSGSSVIAGGCTAGAFGGAGCSVEPVWELGDEAGSFWIVSQPSAGLQVIQVDEVNKSPSQHQTCGWICTFFLSEIENRRSDRWLQQHGAVTRLGFVRLRFSPYYRTKEKLSLSSVTYSNAIEPAKCFCRFDLTGTCNDDDCRW